MCLVTQSRLTLCDPKDRSLPGSSDHGILQARIMDGMACPPPGDLPNPGIEQGSLALQADSLPTEPPGKPCCLEDLALNLGSVSYNLCDP